MKNNVCRNCGEGFKGEYYHDICEECNRYGDAGRYGLGRQEIIKFQEFKNKLNIGYELGKGAIYRDK